MKRHMKALATPNSWTLLKKENTFTLRPLPGAHPFERGMTIALVLKTLGFAQTTKEVKHILNQGSVLVDGRPIKDVHTIVGFMDVLELKEAKKHIRLSLSKKGKLTFLDIKAAEADKKLSKIIGKSVIKGGKIQLNLSDGRNVLVDAGNYAVGDSVVIQVPSQKITDHIALAKGMTVFLLGGRHTGDVGIVDEVKGDHLWFAANKKKLETLKKFAFIVGKDKPLITIQ